MQHVYYYEWFVVSYTKLLIILMDFSSVILRHSLFIKELLFIWPLSFIISGASFGASDPNFACIQACETLCWATIIVFNFDCSMQGAWTFDHVGWRNGINILQLNIFCGERWSRLVVYGSFLVGSIDNNNSWLRYVVLKDVTLDTFIIISYWSKYSQNCHFFLSNL